MKWREKIGFPETTLFTKQGKIKEEMFQEFEELLDYENLLKIARRTTGKVNIIPVIGEVKKLMHKYKEHA